MYRSKSLLRVTLALYLLSATAMIVLAVEIVLQTPVTNELYPGFFFCSAKAGPARKRGLAWYWWLPIIALEFYLFVLALLQLVQNVQYMRKRTLIFARPKYLFEVVLRDSIWYFAFVICIDVATVIIWQRTSGSVESGSQWTNGLLVPFFAFVSSRLNFDLRELNRRKVEGEDVSDVIGVSGEGSENPTGIAFVSDVRESNIISTVIED